MQRARTIQTVLGAVILVAAIVFFARQFAVLRSDLSASQGASWWWLGIALFFQATYYPAYGSIFRTAFTTLGAPITIRQSVSTALRSRVIGIVTPGGALGNLLFVEQVKKNGHESGKAYSALLIALASDYLGLFFLAGISTIFLRGAFTATEQTAATIVAGMIATIITVLTLLLLLPNLLARVLTPLEHLLLLIKIPRGWAHRGVETLRQTIAEIWHHRRAFLICLLWSLAAHATNLAVFAAIFLAFHQPIFFSQLLVVYTTAMLLVVFSPTPQGIGIVEGAASALLISFGFATPIALAVVLLFRVYTFWLPLLLGIASFAKNLTQRIPKTYGR
jgi:phosphatidylglycerol lysyltransferase